ncbi:hypothetical protein H6G33_26150 [Calothrix sp. FACHB-1219]|uniref:TRADD-N-associated membrane domain-containing protein n=1 Tax=unclassified Calothrix TaxID=2619626 RepID=UPI0016855605|nr:MULTISPECIES: hypothetical protein [unclassified Calothrix]MBD2204185.1 hypothetical protein [Calothrix sp. FACHB-168]MBD2220491.1 hypothetical protein [Calothrix sp. FACHB-1219]
MVRELERKRQSAKFPETAPAVNDDPYLKIVLDVSKEHLRQARQTFNLSLVAIYASVGMSLIGAFLLISGRASEGSVTTAIGLISTKFCTQITKESSQKLEHLRQNLKELRPELRK